MTSGTGYVRSRRPDGRAGNRELHRATFAMFRSERLGPGGGEARA